MVINFGGGGMIPPMGRDCGGGSGDGMMMAMAVVAVW